MPLSKALAAISAGALLLIGQSALAQDPYTDRTQDRSAATQTQAEIERDRTSAAVRSDVQVRTQDEDDEDEDEFVAQEDDEFLEDDEFVAQEDDPFVAEDDDDFVAAEDDEFVAEDDEFFADEEFTAEERTTTTETEFETEERRQQDLLVGGADVRTQTRVVSGIPTGVGVHERVIGFVPCPPTTEVVEVVEVDHDKLHTLAMIHTEMFNETRELSEQHDATETAALRNDVIERQVEVIERHGWTREEYNQVVQQVSEDPDLESQLVELVVQHTDESDEQVAGEFEDDLDVDADAQASVEFDDDVEDDTVVMEDDRDW